MDLNWIIPYLPGLEEDEKNSVVLKLEALNGAGGLNAAMKTLTVEVPGKSGYPKKYIYKTVRDNGLPNSKNLGLPREALFYDTLAKVLAKEGVSMPPVIYSHGNMETGEKTIIMEDLTEEVVQSGYYFGGGSPLNWGKDLDQLMSKFTEKPTAKEISLETFTQVAKMHRKYWMNETLLENAWLKGVDWVRSEGEQTWRASQTIAANSWAATKQKINEGQSKVNWDANLVACIDASIAKADWKEYLADLQSRPWTLAHGDLHPANMLWSEKLRGESHLMLLDWEVVGVGSGPQDLAQYLISHTAPAQRREYEKELVQSYYAVLTDVAHGGVDATGYSFEQCWRDYVRGGSERWVWLAALLSAMCPDAMNQYFQDQVSAFFIDHGITPETVGMPRV